MDAQVATSKVRKDFGRGDDEDEDDEDRHQGKRTKLDCQRHDVLHCDLAAIRGAIKKLFFFTFNQKN